MNIRILLLLLINFVCCSAVEAGTISFEIEGQTVKHFEARGMTYADIHKVAAAFAGVKDELAASPPELMQLTLKDKQWGEILLALYDPDLFVIEKRGANKLVVTRKPR